MLKKDRKLILGIILTVILLLGVTFSLFRRGYFSMHDDIQVMRLYEMEKCFFDGQIPCRWVPDMGSGFGSPLYNFYSVFPYYLGIFFRLFGLSFVLIVKILFGLSIVLSGIFMYFLSKEFFGKMGGVISAVFYLYAPYHAVDVYVRGALAESWAIAFFPLIFFSVYKYIQEDEISWYVLSIFSLAGLFLSHNIMSMIFIPFLILWTLFWIISKKRKVWKTLSIFILAVGLSAFYLIPAFVEKSLINVSWLTSNYFNYQIHFVSLKQLFLSNSFGYGPSILGEGDTISFQIGWVHTLSIVLVVLMLVGTFIKKQKIKFYFLFLILGLWIFSVFMTHAKSFFIWKTIHILAFVQFPWRFLALSAFIGSFAAAGIVVFIKGKTKLLIVSLMLMAVVLLNIGFFRPEKFYPEKTDEKILSGESLKEQSRGSLLDYLSWSVKEIPKDMAPQSPWVVNGTAVVTEFKKRSDFWRFTIDVSENKPAKVGIPVFNFPIWEVLVDQVPVAVTNDNGGAIEVVVPSGKHTVVGWFRNTPIRAFSNWLSLFSVAAIIIIVLKNEKTV